MRDNDSLNRTFCGLGQLGVISPGCMEMAAQNGDVIVDGTTSLR